MHMPHTAHTTHTTTASRWPRLLHRDRNSKELIERSGGGIVAAAST